MKLNYFGYSIHDHKNNSNYLMDIRPFIKAFCSYEDIEYKNNFTHAGEKVFLLPVSGNIYLFLMTRSNEIIKKIKSSDLSISEVYDLLQRGEMLGFASYLYMSSSYFGFASTIMAPKFSYFSEFINDIFCGLGLSEYSFVSNPLMKQSSKEEVLEMPFIGRSVIQINKQNTFFEDIRNFAGGTSEEFLDIDSFEITIKPRNRKNIEVAVKKFVNSIPDAGLEKMLVRAKDDYHGTLVDLYIAGVGAVSDSINTKEESKIYDEILKRVKSNEILKEKVVEHESNETFEKKTVEAISGLHDSSAWANYISNL